MSETIETAISANGAEYICIPQPEPTPLSVSVGGELQEKTYLPKSTTRWAFKKMVEANNPYGGTLVQKSSTEEEREWTEKFLKELGFISTEELESMPISVSVVGELQENPEPEPTPISVSVGDELQEKRFLPKSTLQWSMMKMMERGANQGTLIDYTHAEEETARSLELFYKITTSNCIQNETEKSEPEPVVSVSVGVELQEPPEPEPTPISVSVGDEINTYGPTMKAVPPDSDTVTPVSYVGVGEPPTAADTTVTDTTTPDTSVDPGSLDGPNPIGGGHHQYHFVQYGETQEYLESLVKEGYMMVYHEDNPPEEGKLTISKPNPEPGTITFVANPTDTTADPSNNLEYNSLPAADTTGADPAGLIAGMKSYLEEIAPKMSDIDSLTDEEVASFNETLKSFKDALRQAGVATYLADTTLDPRTDTGMNPETFDPRTDTSLNDLLDSYIAALDEKEAKTADTTGTTEIPADVAAEIDALPKGLVDLNKEYIAARDELIAKTGKEPNSSEVFSYMVELVKSGKNQSETTVSADTTVNDTTDRTITLPGGLIVKLSDVLLVTDSLSDDTNTYFYRVSDYINPETGRLEDIPIPLYVCKNSEQVAFISTMDAETEAVTSVQVACADTDGWRTIGTLNPDGIDWKYKAGNLTGSGTASVVWHAQELGALGVWTDGTDNWTGIAGWFDENWTMLGCGDFDGDGKDSVLMSLNGGLFYSVDLDGTLTSLGDLNWSGWEFGAVGDFAGDGKDDIVLFHRESGTVVLLADGNADDYTSIGQLDATDWGIAGVRDFNGDGIDDLLVHQDSTGLIGGYAGADMNQWSVIDTTGEYYLA